MPMPSSLPYPILCPDKPDLVQTIRTNADDRAAWCCSYYITGDLDHIDGDYIYDVILYSGTLNFTPSDPNHVIDDRVDRAVDEDRYVDEKNLFLKISFR